MRVNGLGLKSIHNLYLFEFDPDVDEATIQQLELILGQLLHEHMKEVGRTLPSRREAMQYITYIYYIYILILVLFNMKIYWIRHPPMLPLYSQMRKSLPLRTIIIILIWKNIPISLEFRELGRRGRRNQRGKGSPEETPRRKIGPNTSNTNLLSH